MSVSTSFTASFPYKCVGIVYGAGNYPKMVLEACLKKGISCCVAFVAASSDSSSNSDAGDVSDAGGDNDYAGISDISADLDDERFSDIPKIRAKLGKIGSIIRFFRENSVDAVVFAGAVKRPPISELSLDSKGASWLLKLGRSMFGGDDELLRGVAQLLKQEGFAVISGTDLIGDIFLKNGVFSSIEPTDQEWEDIRKGFKIAKTIGHLDIGQSAIICNGDVLGIECVEGTDELIKRCARLRKQQSGGILVKASKPQQDQRLDLPTVGLRTLENLHNNGFRGLAIESFRCIVLEKDNFIKTAQELSMLLVGVE